MKKHLLISSVLLVIISISHAQNIEELKEINTTPGGSSYPFNFTVAGDKLFFTAFDPVDYNKLWVSDGSNATTQLLGPSGGALSSISNLEAYKGKLYFSFNDNINGQELWTSDGTVAGTKIFKDIYGGSTGSYPQAFTVCNNKLFFMANDIKGERKLYISDGTSAGTVPLENKSTNLLNGVDSFAVMNNDIYFTSDNGTGSGYGFWKTDGTSAGTILLKPDFSPGTSPGNYAVLNNKLYFNGSDFIYGSELWVSDGTSAGTHILKNINPNDGGGVQSNGAPYNMEVYNNKIYFAAADGTHGSELWVTDGTTAGTQMVKDILPGSDGSLPSRGVVYNGLLYFTCYPTSDLWETDGTEAGTTLVKIIPPYSSIAAVWNNKMYLTNNFDNAAWESDGTATGTKAIQVQNTAYPVNIYGNDQLLTTYKNDLYFSGNCYLISGAYEPLKLTLGTLPLQLISFTGEVKNNQDVLTWKTTNEINTAYFSVQQSTNGVAFNATTKVMAKGGNATTATYSYTQQSALNTSGYYRLQMVDKDGSFTYSPVIKLNRGNTGAITAIYHSGTKQITINNNTQTNYNWQLVSIGGSFISKGNASNGITTVPVSGIAAGTYMLVCTSPEATEKIKLVIF